MGLGTLFVVGLAARLVFLPSEPILEDDWHRYLWDGAVTAQGLDPYAHAPGHAAPLDAFGNLVPEAEDRDLRQLQAMAKAEPTLFSRINYPFVTTIYPPVAQMAFALGYHLEPFSVRAWRLVLIAVDCLTFALLWLGSRAYGVRPFWIALYWWNPIVIMQGFNAAHMDILLTPFLAGVLLLHHGGRGLTAAGLLAGAVGVKVWPALLLPSLLRIHIGRLWRVLAMVGVFGILCGLVLMPQLVHLGSTNAGLNLYTESWQRSSFLFPLIRDGFTLISGDPEGTARLFVALAVGLVALGAAWAYAEHNLPKAMLVATAALYFLSPTGYPWYGIWLFVLLPFAPSLGLAALTVTLPLYPLRFFLGDDAVLYQWIIVPLIYGGPLALVVWETFRNRFTAVPEAVHGNT